VARGELKRELVTDLRRHHNQRNGRNRGTVAAQGCIKDSFHHPRMNKKAAL